MTLPLHQELTPSEADIELRLCEIDSDEFIIKTFEDICTDDYGCFRMGLEDIMRFVCAELPFSEYDGDEFDVEAFSCALSIIQDVVCDWLHNHITELQTFADVTRCIKIEPLVNGAYKIKFLSKITTSIGGQYIPTTLPAAEMKERKIFLAALAALRHERSAEIAYLKNDIAAFAVHFSYVWWSYARLATYPALHDGRVLQEARAKGSNRPKVSRRRNAIKALLKRMCPDYLNEDITYFQIWEKVRKGLGKNSKVTDCDGYKFWFDPKSTDSTLDETSTDGEIVENLPGDEIKPIGFSGFSRVIRLLRQLR